ncbi:MAG: DAK2 domain-containing protein [Enterocloster bolteae]
MAKREMGPGELADFLAGFAGGIAHRGKCQLGDRTILDAVDAGAKEGPAGLDGGRRYGSHAAPGRGGAKEGVKATEDMLPKYGKSSRVFS